MYFVKVWPKIPSQSSWKNIYLCKGGDHPAVHAVLQQAVCLEHDDVREAALAWQRLPRGEQPAQNPVPGKQVNGEKNVDQFLILYTSIGIPIKYSLSRLLNMRDVRPGPRIGMVHDLQFYEYFLDNGKYPDEGIKRTAYSNSGMMLLKPGEAK